MRAKACIILAGGTAVQQRELHASNFTPPTATIVISVW